MSEQITGFSVINNAAIANSQSSGVDWYFPMASASPTTHKRFANHAAIDAAKHFAAYGDCGTWSDIG